MSGDKLPEGVEILDYNKMSEGERFAPITPPTSFSICRNSNAKCASNS